MSQVAVEAVDEDVIELGELTSSLGFLLRIAQVQAFDAFYATLERYGLKPGEFSVLWVISLNPGLRQGTIARRLNIKPAHMTKLVHRMVNEGYVRRVVPKNDRRSIRLSLTPEGEEFLGRNRKEFLRHNQTEGAGLSEAEIDQLTHLLRKLTGMEDAGS